MSNSGLFRLAVTRDVSAGDYGKEERVLRTVTHASLVTREVTGDKSGFNIALLVVSRGNFGALWGFRCKSNASPIMLTLQWETGIL